VLALQHVRARRAVGRPGSQVRHPRQRAPSSPATPSRSPPPLFFPPVPCPRAHPPIVRPPPVPAGARPAQRQSHRARLRAAALCVRDARRGLQTRARPPRGAHQQLRLWRHVLLAGVHGRG
jgi:hypothetical protein